jgi:hypothetical protein
MTKLQLIISIIPLLIADISYSVWQVKKYQPQNDKWKIPVWIIATLIVTILSIITSINESMTWWMASLLIPAIALAYMELKNASLGIIWHKNPFYLGKKGFDASIARYFQNGQLLAISLAIATLVFSGLWGYVRETYKPNKY